MSETRVRVRASTAKPAKAKRVRAPTAEDVLQAEFDAMMERSSQRLAKLNADMDELLARMNNNRPRS
jgi:hypothetical protein